MNKMITGTVSILVIIVMLTAVLMPIVGDAEKSISRTETTTLNNEGTPLMMGDVAEDYTMTWDSALPGMMKVNGDVTTVYFVAGSDATVSPSSKNVTVDLTYGELPVPVRNGYTFAGWFTSTQYTTEVTEDTIVEGKADKTLYAKWTPNTYTVTFDADGGTVSPATKTVTMGQAYGELPVPEYYGHIFGGWFDSNDNPITATTVFTAADDVTLTAVWTLDNYLVSFTTDGNGTVDVQSMTVDYGTAYTISSNTITIGSTVITATPNTNYVFDSWTPSTSGTIEGATTFTANFNLPPVTITFTAQSPGTVSSGSIADVPRGTQYVVADNVVTITGFTPVTASLPDNYYMTGWNVAQGVGTITGEMTFTAEYEMIEVDYFTSNEYTSWILTTDGKLFGCGSNHKGQLGDGTTTNALTFSQRLSNETISKVVADYARTWIVTTDGKLFGCGSNYSGQQGSGDTNDVLTFTQRLENETISDVGMGDSTTWALTTDGKLFGCGTNTHGSLGLGNTTTSYTFIQLLSNETISKVIPAYYRTWAITTDGKLFGTGENTYGEQGSGNTTDVTTFTQRLSNETIASILPLTSTWVITTDGKLFGCGNNGGGQQGDGTTTNVTTFTQRLENETVSKVVSHGLSVWALTTDGKLFGCGSNNYGELSGGSEATITTFTQRLDNETISDVFISYTSSWAITTDGKLFGCGKNDYGQQGSGSSGGAYNVKTFTQRLSNETISDVIQGLNETWAITTDGKLFGCGRNNNGQQGSGNTTDVKTFTQRLNNESIEKAYSISKTSGSSDNLNTWAITTDGKLFGCGKNAYGQQGSGDTNNVLTFTQRGPPGSVNISTPSVIPNAINPIHLNPHQPFTPVPLVLNSISPNDIIGTDYTFHAGGNDWMLATVSVGQDQYALALYYEGLTAPLLWDEDVTMTFSNGSLTVENGGNTYTMDYTTIFFKDSNGTYVLNDGTNGYVKNDTPIIGYSIPVSGSGIEVTGTPSSLTAMSIADGSITVGSTGAIVTADTDYDDVKSFSEISASYDTDGKAICTSVILPKTVTISKTTTDETMRNIVSIIPLIITVSAILGIIGLVVIRKQ